MVEKNRLMLWGLDKTSVPSTMNLGLATSVMDSVFVALCLCVNKYQQIPYNSGRRSV